MHQALWYAIPAGIAVVLIVWAVALRAPRLPPRPSIPEPEDNAWDYMTRAAAMVSPPERNLPKDLRRFWADPHLPAADRLAAVAPALAELRRGLHNPCRLPDGIGESAALLPTMSGLNGLLHGLQAEVTVLLGQGRADDAIGSVRDIIRLGRNLLCNGWGMGVLFAGALETAGAHAMVQIVETGSPSADALREFVAWNEANRTLPQSLADMLLIEHYDYIAAVEAQIAQRPPTNLRGRMIRVIARPFERVWLAGSARKLVQVMGHVSRPYPEWGPTAAHEAMGTSPRNYLTSPLYMTACAWANADAARIGLSVRCALEAYRVERGCLPATVHELAPEYIAELPKDPMSGDDFIYRTGDEFGEQGYILYSVGLDGEDDGGIAWSPQAGRGDLVFGPG